MDTIFKDIAKKFKKETIFDICQIIFTEDFIKNWIIETIQDRLYNTGVDSFGKKLQTDLGKLFSTGSGYSTFTEYLKKEKGQRIANVTLNDTGDFYNSFEIEVKKTFFDIKAEFQKSNGNIFENFSQNYSNLSNFEEAILNLTDSEMETFLNELFQPRLVSNLIYKLSNV